MRLWLCVAFVLQHLHSSTRKIFAPPCGHFIHENCYKMLLSSTYAHSPWCRWSKNEKRRKRGGCLESAFVRANGTLLSLSLKHTCTHILMSAHAWLHPCSFRSKCPVCAQSFLNLSTKYKQIDDQIKRTPMVSAGCMTAAYRHFFVCIPAPSLPCPRFTLAHQCNPHPRIPRGSLHRGLWPCVLRF